MSDALFPELTRDLVESVRGETALADKTRLRDAVRRAVNERIGTIVDEIIRAERETLIDPIVRAAVEKAVSREDVAYIISDNVRTRLRARAAEEAKTLADGLQIKIEVTR